MMCTLPHWGPLPGERILKVSYPFLYLFRCCWYPPTATPPQQHRRNCNTGEPQALLKASVGTARPESSGKLSSKLYKTALAATFTSFSSSLPPCRQQTCFTWLTKQSTCSHPTALTGRRLCVSRAGSQRCRDWLQDPEVGAAWLKTELALCSVIF